MEVQSQTIRFSTQAKIITVALIVGLSILLIMSVGPVLTPFIAAIITAYIFNPLVTMLHRRTRLRRSFWIVILYILAFSLISGMGTWVWPRLVRQYDDLTSRIPSIILSITDMFDQQDTLDLGMNISLNLQPLEEQFITTISDLGRTMSENVPHLVFSAMETFIYTVVYLIVTFYLLLQSRELAQWTTNLIPPPYRTEICGVGRQIDQVLNAYIRGQLMLIVIMSVLTYIPLTILQVPYALVIAIASGVLELIPIMGPWIAAAVAITSALFQPETPFGLSSMGVAGLIGLIYFTLRQIEENFIVPNIMGHLIRLHPTVVIFAVLAGGVLAGALGLLIAIPIAAVLRILLSYLYAKVTDSFASPEPLLSELAETTTRKEPLDVPSRAEHKRSSDSMPCIAEAQE